VDTVLQGIARSVLRILLHFPYTRILQEFPDNSGIFFPVINHEIII